MARVVAGSHMGGCRGGQRGSDRTDEGWMDSGHPPHCDQGSQSQNFQSGTRGHECRALSKPWSSHSTGATLWRAAERRRGHAGAGQERKHWPESVPVTQHPDHIKDKQTSDPPRRQPARRAFTDSFFICTAPVGL